MGGYDERRLIKLELNTTIQPEDIVRASCGVSLISQEEGNVILAFATEAQLEEFEAKLNSIASGEQVTYTNIMYALQDLSTWTAADRTGWALKRDGFPDVETIVIDVELWPLAQEIDSNEQSRAFEEWLSARRGEIIDSVLRPHLAIYRIRCTRPLAEEVLQYRDVRTVDLPPRIGLERSVINVDIQQIPDIAAPPRNAPSVVVLDSGIVAGHPVLAPAVGDTQSFLPGSGPNDAHGHGTFVSGVALYDDIADCIRNRHFLPELRLFSGRILDDRNESQCALIENQVEDAVRYFVEHYGCKIFNLSYGDLNKPYLGRHVAGLAVTLDVLSRELGVLFIVPTGNYQGDDQGPNDWLEEYPNYLVGDPARIVDPAPALNVLTVGSLARYERGRPNQRWPNDPAYIPIARNNQPSPFTRHGPSVNGAVKPELVDYGGNNMIDARVGNHLLAGAQGVGELSTSHNFASGQPFVENSGTSFAAPRVSRAAAGILAELPNASAELCRAMMVAHARIPAACTELFAYNEDALRNIAGYGKVDRSALLRSLDDCVTLWAEGLIENRRHHFYEIPIPNEFWEGGRRERELTVSLAYCPAVRTTRIDYRAANVTFKMVQAPSLTEVAQSFNAAIERDEAPRIKERTSGRGLSETARSAGTIQASTWTFVRPSSEMQRDSWFVVVTRNDPAWGTNLSNERENYALAIVLSDRLASQQRLGTSQLYAQVQAILRGRGRGRGRARV